MCKDVSEMNLRRFRLVLASAVLCLLGTAATGCNMPLRGAERATGSTPTISAVRHPALEDFPMPSGFMLVDDHSQSVQTGNMRIIQYEFVGNASRDVVTEFFREKLPTAGWTYLGERFERGPRLLRFKSDKEECSLRIERDGHRTILNIDIQPVPRGSAEKQARPATRRP